MKYHTKRTGLLIFLEIWKFY